LNSIISTTSSTSSIGLTWMLSITYSKLGSSSFYRLPFVVVAWNTFPPPPPISSEHVHSSSCFEWRTCDLKIVLDFFLGGEVISLGLNLSLGVGGYVCVFNLWNRCTSKGKDVVERVGLLSFNN
jgi:hypothetical protein